MHTALDRFLGRAFSGTFAVYGAGIALAFATQVLLTRLLGVDAYGDYYFVLAWVMALLIPAKFGLDIALLRFFPGYLAHEQWSLLHGLVRWSARTAAVATLVVVAAFAAGIAWQTGFSNTQGTTFLLGCLVLAVTVYVYLRAALLRSLKHVVLALLPEAVVAPLVLGITITLIWVLADTAPGADDAMAATLAGLLVSAMLGKFLLDARMPGEIRRHPASTEARTWLVSSRAMLLITGSHALLNNTDAIMLGLLRDASAVGIYAVAAKCAILVSFPLTIANASIAPLVPHFHATGELAPLQHAIRRSMQLVSAASLAAFVAVFWLGEWLLGIFGAAFTGGETALRILVLGALVNALAGPVANLLSLTGSERFVSRVMLATVLANVVLNLALIPRWGIEGAAAATALSMAGWNLLLFRAARRRLAINPNPLLPLTARTP